jgi:electron transfer flavoprotein beta subunit
MNIIVLLKQVPDTESVIQISASGTGIETEEIKWVINPYDEFAIEEALLIKEANADVTITALTAGTENADASLKIAYALGVDEAVRLDITDLPDMDSLSLANILAPVIKERPFDLIIAGQRALDTDNYQIPAMVAELLDIPLICNITKQEISGETVICHQAMDGGYFRIGADLPAVLTAAKGLNEPRYPNMRAIMKARKRSVETVKADDKSVFSEAEVFMPQTVKNLSFQYPPQRKQGRIIEGATPEDKAQELIKILKAEAEVI